MKRDHNLSSTVFLMTVPTTSKVRIFKVFFQKHIFIQSLCPILKSTCLNVQQSQTKKFNRHSQKVLKLIDLKMSKSEPQKKAPIILNPKSSKQP